MISQSILHYTISEGAQIPSDKFIKQPVLFSFGKKKKNNQKRKSALLQNYKFYCVAEHCYIYIYLVQPHHTSLFFVYCLVTID